MAATVWKGYITFGLISIPVRLFAAARPERVSFHLVHDVCQTRIKQQLYCPSCERVVERSELVKGYEVEKNRFVTVKDEELKRVAPPSRDTMEIQEFVKIDQVDPLYYDTSYYALPEDPGRRAYHLLVETMGKSRFAAIAKVAMHQREYTVIIRPREHGLTLHTLYYQNEVRKLPGYGETADMKVKPQEIALAEQLVESLAAPFKPNQYSDEYQGRVLELIEAKSQGRTLREAKVKRAAPVVDLMQALQRSLRQAESAEKKPAARAPHAKRAAGGKQRSRKRAA